jgi:hypothetical protein
MIPGGVSMALRFVAIEAEKSFSSSCRYHPAVNLIYAPKLSTHLLKP